MDKQKMLVKKYARKYHKELETIYKLWLKRRNYVIVLQNMFAEFVVVAFDLVVDV